MINNIKHYANFITPEERELILKFISSLSGIDLVVDNNHIKTVLDKINGSSFIFDITKTKVSTFLATFQSSGNVIDMSLPDVFSDILYRISSTLSLVPINAFLQIIVMHQGGKIIPHYDTSYNNIINYKCNISVLSDKYDFYIDKNSLTINEGDLYCFEASLYKHWTNPFENKRVLLSYGLGLSYDELGRNEDDPRVRMSNRILKYIQK